VIHKEDSDMRYVSFGFQKITTKSVIPERFIGKKSEFVLRKLSLLVGS
jgi:hypothetical protein